MSRFIFIGEKEELQKIFFNEDFIRGGSMGWAHKLDTETNEIKFVDEEYATKYEKIGGLKLFIQDLIEKKMVKEV